MTDPRIIALIDEGLDLLAHIHETEARSARDFDGDAARMAEYLAQNGVSLSIQGPPSAHPADQEPLTPVTGTSAPFDAEADAALHAAYEESLAGYIRLVDALGPLVTALDVAAQRGRTDMVIAGEHRMEAIHGRRRKPLT